MVDNNNKYFFRQDEIDAEVGVVTNIPADVEWAVTKRKISLPAVRPGGAGFGSGSGSSLTPGGDTDQGVVVETEPGRYAERKPTVPQILGVRSQEVSQDPQGNAVISATFIVTDIPGVEYEMRLTRG